MVKYVWSYTNWEEKKTIHIKKEPSVSCTEGSSDYSVVIKASSEDYALMAGAVSATGAASPAAKSKGKL